MANASVLKEFLISLGFKVDESAQRKFVDSLSGIQENVEKLSLGLSGLATGVIAAVDKMAASAAQMSFISQYFGTSIKDFNATAYAATQLGMSFDAIKGQFFALNQALLNNPTLQSVWRNAVPEGDKGTREEQLARLGERLRNMREAERGVVIDNLRKQGINLSDELVRVIQDPRFAEAGKERNLLQQMFGFNPDEFGKQSEKYEQSLGKLKTILGDISGIGASKSIDSMTKSLDYVSNWLEQHAKGIHDTIDGIANFFSGVGDKVDSVVPGFTKFAEALAIIGIDLAKDNPLLALLGTYLAINILKPLTAIVVQMGLLASIRLPAAIISALGITGATAGLSVAAILETFHLNKEKQQKIDEFMSQRGFKKSDDTIPEFTDDKGNKINYGEAIKQFDQAHPDEANPMANVAKSIGDKIGEALKSIWNAVIPGAHAEEVPPEGAQTAPAEQPTAQIPAVAPPQPQQQTAPEPVQPPIEVAPRPAPIEREAVPAPHEAPQPRPVEAAQPPQPVPVEPTTPVQEPVSQPHLVESPAIPPPVPPPALPVQEPISQPRLVEPPPVPPPVSPVQEPVVEPKAVEPQPQPQVEPRLIGDVEDHPVTDTAPEPPRGVGEETLAPPTHPPVPEDYNKDTAPPVDQETQTRKFRDIIQSIMSSIPDQRTKDDAQTRRLNENLERLNDYLEGKAEEFAAHLAGVGGKLLYDATRNAAGVSDKVIQDATGGPPVRDQPGEAHPGASPEGSRDPGLGRPAAGSKTAWNDPNVKYAMKSLMLKGYSMSEAAAIVGNFGAESGLNINAENSTGHVGIAQWDHARAANFKSIYGHDLKGAPLEEQLAFFDKEMREDATRRHALQHLRNAKTIEEMTRIIDHDYEVSEGTTGRQLTDFAHKAYTLGSHVTPSIMNTVNNAHDNSSNDKNVHVEQNITNHIAGGGGSDLAIRLRDQQQRDWGQLVRNGFVPVN